MDTGAWIALALSQDPEHDRARVTWHDLRAHGVRIHVSVPVVIETFTFLDRNATREVAVAWRQSLDALPRLRVHDATVKVMDQAWPWFERREFHCLSLVDAISFVVMARGRIRTAFAFDHHFAQAGFRMLG